MNKWYGVQNCYYDNGKVTAMIINIVEQEGKPEDTFASLRRCDCYLNWFDSQESAMDFIKECNMA